MAIFGVSLIQTLGWPWKAAGQLPSPPPSLAWPSSRLRKESSQSTWYRELYQVYLCSLCEEKWSHVGPVSTSLLASSWRCAPHPLYPCYSHALTQLNSQEHGIFSDQLAALEGVSNHRKSLTPKQGTTAFADTTALQESKLEACLAKPCYVSDPHIRALWRDSKDTRTPLFHSDEQRMASDLDCDPRDSMATPRENWLWEQTCTSLDPATVLTVKINISKLLFAGMLFNAIK